MESYSNSSARTVSRNLTYLLVSLLLFSCAAPPKKSSMTKPAPQIEQEQEPKAHSIEGLLLAAKSAHGESKYEHLLKAADISLSSDYRKSLIIIENLTPLLSKEADLSKANLIWAQALMLKGEHVNALKKLSKTVASPEITDRFYQLQASLFQHNGEWLRAAQSLSQQATAQDAEIWSLLNRVSTQDIEEHVKKASLLSPLLQLQLIQRTFATQPDQLSQAWSKWQKRYPNIEFSQSPPDSLLSLLSSKPYLPQKIAVVLPLSGRLAAQGETIKEGILAAYFGQQASNSINNQRHHQAELAFVDSQLDVEEVAGQLAGVDFVVGPLLKDNIVKLHPYITSPWLALNFTEQTKHTETEIKINTAPHNETQHETHVPALTHDSSRYYFALSPEDEGIQIARHLHKMQYQKPLVIKANNSAAQRMADAFKLEWQALTPSLLHQVEEIPFTNTQSMRSGISDMLEITGSKKRIKEVEALVLKEVHTFERNRRDADAVIIFANAPQTELITPFIEANTSPFAKILPVYASSRSHTSNKNLNSLRDLRNLRFLDMPWMLPNHQASALKASSKTLWPEKRDSDQRLFAMGYDAYGLITHLKALEHIDQYQYQGLTGSINMDDKYQLRRELQWGQIKDEKVVKLEQK